MVYLVLNRNSHVWFDAIFIIPCIYFSVETVVNVSLSYHTARSSWYVFFEFWTVYQSLIFKIVFPYNYNFIYRVELQLR